MADNLSSMLDGMGEVYRLVGDNPISSTMTVVGFLLFGFALLFANKVIKEPDKRPREVARPSIVMMYVGLIGGIAFVALGALLIIVSDSAGMPKTSAAQGLSHLQHNTTVKWVARLIAYNPVRQPELSIGRLSKIGKPGQRFTFVADYAELQGYPVDEAVRKLGLQIAPGDHVSAVVFPLQGQLYPANARGVLQVIQRLLDTESGNPLIRSLDPVKKNIDGLGEEARQGLKDLHRESWAWSQYKNFYGPYCKVVQRFRCDLDSGAKAMIGEISPDWHPLGFARVTSDDLCENKDEVCKATDWKSDELLPSFGTRVFLIENFDIASLNGHYLINFNDPQTQILPYITVPSRKQAGK